MSMIFDGVDGAETIARAHHAISCRNMTEEHESWNTHFIRMSSLQGSTKFFLVQEAWETLRDSDLRREYDSLLEIQEADVVVSDEVM